MSGVHTAWRLLKNIGLVVLVISYFLGLLQKPLILFFLTFAMTGISYSSGLLRLTTPTLWLLSIQQCGVFWIGSSLE